MEYCINRACPFKDCKNHCSHAPHGFAVTVCDMDKTCRRYIDWLVEEEARKERMKNMTIGTAVGIFQNIDWEDIHDEEKGTAILMVLDMPTHNSITKEKMLQVIRYLLRLAFDFEEGNANDQA